MITIPYHVTRSLPTQAYFSSHDHVTSTTTVVTLWSLLVTSRSLLVTSRSQFVTSLSLPESPNLVTVTVFVTHYRAELRP